MEQKFLIAIPKAPFPSEEVKLLTEEKYYNMQNSYADPKDKSPTEIFKKKLTKVISNHERV